MAKIDDGIYESVKHGGYVLKGDAIDILSEGGDEAVRVYRDTVDTIFERELEKRDLMAGAAYIDDAPLVQALGDHVRRALIAVFAAGR